MPGEIIVAVCTHLDPRSILSLTAAHRHFNQFVDDKQIWVRIMMAENWSFTNETFAFMHPFLSKVKHISFRHSGSMVPNLSSYLQGAVSKMVNLRSLSIESDVFTQGFFVQCVPHLHTLHFLCCPNFDVETLVEALQRIRRSKSLMTIDLSGVPNVSSFNKWLICSICPNLEEGLSNAVMGDFVTLQCFLDCPKLVTFDCWPLRCTKNKWVELRRKYAHITFGPCVRSSL